MDERTKTIDRIVREYKGGWASVTKAYDAGAADERDRLTAKFTDRADEAHKAGNYAMRDELRAAAWLVKNA